MFAGARLIKSDNFKSGLDRRGKTDEIAMELFLEGQQVGPEIGALVLETQLAPYLVPVGRDRVEGDPQEIGDLFVREAFLDELGDADLHGCEV